MGRKLRRSSRTRIAVTGLGLCLGLLTSACGGGDATPSATKTTAGSAGTATAYCTALKAGQADIASFTAGTSDLARFSELVALIKGIAPKAPAKVSGDWKNLAESLGALDDALAKAGIDLPTYIRAAGNGKAPAGVSSAQMAALGRQIGALQDPKVHEYGVAISADAKSTCGIDLKPAGS